MTETRPIYLEEKPPGLVAFMTFTKSHDPDDAKRLYFNKYGRKPEHCFRYKQCLFVGPVPDQKEWNDGK